MSNATTHNGNETTNPKERTMIPQQIRDLDERSQTVDGVPREQFSEDTRRRASLNLDGCTGDLTPAERDNITAQCGHNDPVAAAERFVSGNQFINAGCDMVKKWIHAKQWHAAREGVTLLVQRAKTVDQANAALSMFTLYRDARAAWQRDS